MDIFKKDLAIVNPLLIKILPKQMLSETVFNLDILPTTSGTLAHYSAADNTPGSKGTFFVNKNVTMFNKVIFWLIGSIYRQSSIFLLLTKSKLLVV